MGFRTQEPFRFAPTRLYVNPLRRLENFDFHIATLVVIQVTISWNIHAKRESFSYFKVLDDFSRHFVRWQRQPTMAPVPA